MADVVDPATRSRMMSGIRGKNTRPEMLIRRHLHARGFRYRLHVATLPGKPDIVLPRYRAVILIHGCFWHGHDCHIFKWPASNESFWRNKITRNMAIDERTNLALHQENWRVLTIWECSLKGKYKRPIEQVIDSVEAWLDSNDDIYEIRARNEK
ncbi:MAG: very short patch repair endonuclease [Desulfuromonadaceae bacterium]|nr:very short patch repair endonuclease [Desulfuromonadaceae bacterium]